MNYPSRTAPGPSLAPSSFLPSLLSGSPSSLLGLYFRFLLSGNILGFYMEATRQYGDVVLFETGPWSIYFVNHPDYIKHILQDNYKNYRRSVFFDLLKPLVGQ